MRKSRLYPVVAALFIVLLGLMLVALPHRAAGTLSIHFIDVGQADSILIKTPGSQSILVDGGNVSDGRLVVDYLRSHGVKRLAAIVATHPHEDHIGGLAAVLHAFPVSTVYMPDVVYQDRTYGEFLQAVGDSGAKRIRARAGVSMDAGPGVSARFLAPNGEHYSDLNDYSAVLKVTYKQTAFMLEGDAGAVSEEEMLAGKDSLQADLLKVGHHGSSSATTLKFLEAVSPRYAVISVGAGNKFGHPTLQTLSRLASKMVEVYRTDTSGTIVAASDGKAIRLDKTVPVYIQDARHMAFKIAGLWLRHWFYPYPLLLVGRYLPAR